MASALSPTEWVQQPATPTGQDEQHPFPPSLQWWSPTLSSATEEEDGVFSPFPPFVSPGPLSPFTAFPGIPSPFGSSPFLRPFSPGHPHLSQYQNPTQSRDLKGTPAPSSSQQLLPFAAFAASPPHFTSDQVFSRMSSPPPSNAHLSPSSCGSSCSARSSLQAPPKEAGVKVGFGDGGPVGGRGVLKRHSFLKLPPEVRAAIYQELVPEMELHIAMDNFLPGNGKMFSFYCQNDRPASATSDAAYVGRHWFAMTETEYRRLGSTPRTLGHLACVRIGPRARGLGRDERGWVGLLTSCKAIQEEFAPYLYARPEFIFDDVVTLRRFLETADTTRLRHCVKTLKVSYLVPECQSVGYSPSFEPPRLEAWIRVWQGIALMEGLKRLHVSLIARGAFANREYETQVLGPLMLLRGKRRNNGYGGKLEYFDLVSYEGTRKSRLPEGFEDAPFRYVWQPWCVLGGPELERLARRHKLFVDAHPPYWHHLSSYYRHIFHGGPGELNMRSLYSVM